MHRIRLQPVLLIAVSSFGITASGLFDTPEIHIAEPTVCLRISRVSFGKWDIRGRSEGFDSGYEEVAFGGVLGVGDGEVIGRRGFPGAAEAA